MDGESRNRMIQSAAVLLREHGLQGTSFRDVVAHSGAPRGSIYHHFPGGKAQLVAEAVSFTGQFVGNLMESMRAAGGPIQALRAFTEMWREGLIASDFRAGCPVVAVVTESSGADAAMLNAVAAETFGLWIAAIAEGLVDAAVPAEHARRLATHIVAAIEGAVVLCRASRSSAALDDVSAELEATLVAALREPASPSRP